MESSSWGNAKYDYYYTDYIDKDYPSKLSNKEEKLAQIEQEEAIKAQKRLLSTLEDVDIDSAFEVDDSQDADDLIAQLVQQNKTIQERPVLSKSVSFQLAKEEAGGNCSSGESDQDTACEESDNDHNYEGGAIESVKQDPANNRQRRPIDSAIRKNRGLTPYKKKDYRNPRVKHKLKYQRAISKRRRIVRDAQAQVQRYFGEPTGIKTSTVRSIRL